MHTKIFAHMLDGALRVVDNQLGHIHILAGAFLAQHGAAQKINPVVRQHGHQDAHARQFRAEEVAQRHLQPIHAIMPAVAQELVVPGQSQLHQYGGLVRVHAAAQQAQEAQGILLAVDLPADERAEELMPAQLHHVRLGGIVVGIIRVGAVQQRAQLAHGMLDALPGIAGLADGQPGIVPEQDGHQAGFLRLGQRESNRIRVMPRQAGCGLLRRCDQTRRAEAHALPG